MMEKVKYCIELSDNKLIEDSSCFRLQSDKTTWKKIVSNEVNATDFITIDPFEIIKLQEVDSKIIIDGKTWKLNTTLSRYGEERDLIYDVLVVRNSFPIVPSRNQLISVIKNGDDSLTNALIINANGYFELRNRKTINLSIKDPTIITRYETFLSGYGYVGLDASKDTGLIDLIYNCSLQSWINHLHTARANFFADYSSTSVEELLIEIEEMKKDFSVISIAT